MLKRLKEFRPEFILMSAGFDAHKDDPLCQLNLESKDYYEITRRALESICLDREVAHLKSELMPKYASMIYNGFWWSPERLALQELIDFSQKNVNGEVKLSLYKGNITILGRKSDSSLYRADISTNEEELGAYNQKDAEGFINLNALRLKIKDKN